MSKLYDGWDRWGVVVCMGRLPRTITKLVNDPPTPLLGRLNCRGSKNGNTVPF